VKTLTIFSAGGTTSWTPDADYVFIGAIYASTVGNKFAVISTDPSIAVTLITGGPFPTTGDVIYFCGSLAGVGQLPVRVPILKDQKIYINFNGVASIILYLEPVDAPIEAA